MPRRLSNSLLFLLAVSWCCHARDVAAASLEGEVRFTAAQDQPAWVGQEVKLNLELWSDGFSFGDQLFILPDVPGGFLLQGDSSTVKLSETRGGVAWQGLRYTLLFYPQAAGRLEVPEFDVSYTARAGFGSAPTAFSFRTEPLAVEVRLPPGASPGDLLVTTSAFELEADWDRDLPAEGPLRLQTGDALTLEVRRRAADVPGMVFAPLPLPALDGLGVYPAKPSVRDQVNRGELAGARTDRLTIVCESAGTYVIPELRFQWWDPAAQRLSEKVIPALQLEVGLNPFYGEGPEAFDAAAGRRWLGPALVTGLVLLLLAGVWRLGGPRLVDWLHSWWQGHVSASGEPGRRTGRLLPLNPSRGPGSGSG